MPEAELIALAGDIDINQLQALRAAHAMFQRSSATDVIIDMSAVTFFGSEGVGLVARIHRVAQQRGGTVTVVNATAAAIRVIEICGLRDVIHEERRFHAGTVAVEADPSRRRPTLAEGLAATGGSPHDIGSVIS